MWLTIKCVLLIVSMMTSFDRADICQRSNIFLTTEIQQTEEIIEDSRNELIVLNEP